MQGHARVRTVKYSSVLLMHCLPLTCPKMTAVCDRLARIAQAVLQLAYFRLNHTVATCFRRSRGPLRRRRRLTPDAIDDGRYSAGLRWPARGAAQNDEPVSARADEAIVCDLVKHPPGTLPNSKFET